VQGLLSVDSAADLQVDPAAMVSHAENDFIGQYVYMYRCRVLVVRA